MVPSQNEKDLWFCYSLVGNAWIGDSAGLGWETVKIAEFY